MNITQAAAFFNLRRILLALLVLPLLLGANYCEHKVPVPVVLPPVATMTPANLLAEINSEAAENTIQARVMLDFEDFAQAAKGTKRSIPTVNGLLVMKRPESIRLLVEAPLFSLKIADMVSDGQNFKVAIFWPDSSRKFLIGSNLRAYQKLRETSKNSNPDLARAGALANIRPQHLTDAILINGVNSGPNSLYFVEEDSEIEADPNPNAKRGAQVNRPYYVVALLENRGDGSSELQRRFWFDRTQNGAPLTRQQIFEHGTPISDVTYEGPFQVSGHQFYKKVYIQRRDDAYAVTVSFVPESVQINNEIPQTAFVLENESGLPVVNLDSMADKAQPIKPN